MKILPLPLFILFASVNPARAVSLTEIGDNDFRISHIGPDGDTSYEVLEPAVAYNSRDDEYLVVWWGDNNAPGLAAGEEEIWGQRLDGSGTLIGDVIRVSDMGPDGDANYDAKTPDVAYNVVDNEYLVVWSADDNTGGVVDNDREIFVQRLDADGNEVGTNDVRISDMEPDGDPNYYAITPKVAFNSLNDTYLVVWRGRDTGFGGAESEIFGQRLDADGSEIGTNDFRLSEMGGIGDAFAAQRPDVAYNSVDNEFLVVWRGDDNTVAETEIFGQRLNADGAEVGTDDFQISHMGSDSDTTIIPDRPAVAYDPDDDRYLMAWFSDTTAGSLVNDENEIYGQLLTGAGAETGPDDFRISDMGPDGNASYDAFNPDVAYDSAAREFLVVWQGDDNTGSLIDDEFEMYGQRISIDGLERESDIRLTDMGPDGDARFDASDAALADRTQTGAFLTVVWADDDIAPLVMNESEIFGQRVKIPVPTITTLAPNYGPREGGTDVVMTGSGFESGASVTVDGVAVTDLAFVDATKMTFTTPPGVSGSRDVAVVNPDLKNGRLTGGFHYNFVDLEAIKVFPNPFRPSRGHTSVTIDQLTSFATVGVYTMTGELVRTLTADGTGAVTWDARNDGNADIASGVYMLLSKGGGRKKTSKIVIQR